MKELRVQNEPCVATIEDINSDVIPDPERKLLLLEYVNGTRDFVCLTISGAGRSLYLPENPSLSLPSLKIKGAGGLKLSEDDLVFYSPQHGAFFSGSISHFSLSPDLEFYVTNSDPKALNSLIAANAKMEFTAQCRLKEHGIGFNGVCWGSFGIEDLHGFPTGFSVSEYDPDYIPLSHVLKYRERTKGVLQRIEHDRLDPDGQEFHLHMVQRIGTTKRIMAHEAELGRHSSTLENFLYEPESDDLNVSDADTLIDYRTLDMTEKGSQFLRDGVSDLMKRLSELYFSQPSDACARLATQVVRSFLQGFFGDSVRSGEIDTIIKGLGIRERVKAMRQSYSTGWVYFGDMYPELYEAFYILFLKTSFPDIFSITEIDPGLLRKRAEKFLVTNKVM